MCVRALEVCRIESRFQLSLLGGLASIKPSRPLFNEDMLVKWADCEWRCCYGSPRATGRHVSTVAVVARQESDRLRMSPSVWKQFAHSPCLQCFVFRVIFPLVTKRKEPPLSSVNYTVSGNFIKKRRLSLFFFSANTGCCGCCSGCGVKMCVFLV